MPLLIWLTSHYWLVKGVVIVPLVRPTNHEAVSL